MHFFCKKKLQAIKKSLRIRIFVGYKGYIVSCNFLHFSEQPKDFGCCTK